MRRSLVLALSAATVALAASAPTALALPDQASDVGAAHARRACSAAPAGYAACDALVRTRPDGVTPNATTSYQSGFRPEQLRAAYGINGDGTTTVAVVDAYANPNAASDLAVYRSQFGLGTANLTQVNQTGGTTLPAGDVGWGQEEMLDLEMVSAMCPSCHILYVGANSASFTDLAAAVNTAGRLGAKVISNSYGGNEISSTSISSAYDKPGVAITVSSGDNGYGVESPASFSTVIAVGGTSLTLTSGYARSAEKAWSGAGSGCSSYAIQPSWQKLVTTSCGRRAVADVSAVADPNTGVAVYDSYGSTGGANWMVFGGTSVAAPLIGGIYGVTYTGTVKGNPAQSLYTSRGSLYDVVSGSNGRCTRGKNTSTANLCTAVSGWDGPTGLGAPNGPGAFVF